MLLKLFCEKKIKQILFVHTIRFIETKFTYLKISSDKSEKYSIKKSLQG